MGVGVRVVVVEEAPKMFWRRELMKAVKRDWVLGKGAVSPGEEEEAGLLLVAVVVREAVEAGEFVRTARRSSSKSAALSTIC